MTTQLSLFGDHAQLPMKRQRIGKPGVQSYIIEMKANVHRTAALLDVHPSTLYRKRREGMKYRKGAWIAEPQPNKTWRVTYTGDS